MHPSLWSELHDGLVVLPVHLPSWERMLRGFVGIDRCKKDGCGCWAVNSGGVVGIDAKVSSVKVPLGSGEWFVLVLLKNVGSVFLVKL